MTTPEPPTKRRGTIDLAQRQEFVIVEFVSDSTREIHVGSFRISGEQAILHEFQGLTPDCCVTTSGQMRIVIVPVKFVERVEIVDSLEELIATLGDDGLQIRDHDDDGPRPEVR